MSGPDAELLNPACVGAGLESGDVDADGDIDVRDAAAFQMTFGS
jgi:hypothetical protein